MSTEWRVFRALTIIVKGRVYWEAASFPVAGHLQQAASKELASDSDPATFEIHGKAMTRHWGLNCTT